MRMPLTSTFVAATNFVNYKDVSADQAQRVAADLQKLGNRSSEEVFQDAIQDYQAYFDRVSLTLPTTTTSFLPTDERMESIQTTPDPQLSALAYQLSAATCSSPPPAPAPSRPTSRASGTKT
jgi:alpha-L-fucosidase 2